MNYGLEDKEWKVLTDAFAKCDGIEGVILYGSRAKGNYKPFSDVDITLLGENLTRHNVNTLALLIDDLMLPYQFDISIFNQLHNEDLVDHIKRRGIMIYP